MTNTLDNEFMSAMDYNITRDMTKKGTRVPKINKKSLKRYQNPLLTGLYDRYSQLTPVLQDEYQPSRLRKARTPYWMEYASFGVQKNQDGHLLRELGNTWVAQRCKSIIIDEVLSNKWTFRPADSDDYSNKTSNLIDIAYTFFKSMNRRGQSFKEIMEPYLNDALDLGLGVGVKGFHKDAYYPINTDILNFRESHQPNVEHLNYVPTKVGHGLLRELTPYDSASFYAQPDSHGSTMGWWQWLNQGTPLFFGSREIIPLVLNPTTYSPYGISPVEVVKNLISVLINSVENMEQFMEDGAVPPAIGILSKISKPDYEDFIDRWEAEVEGDPTSIPILSVGEDGEFKFQPLTMNSADIKQLDTLDVYQKIVMSVFHVTPDELGFTDTSNRSVGESQAKVQQRVSTFPFMDKIEVLVNRYILPEIDPERRIIFEFERPKSDEEKNAEWSLVERQLNAGVMTINEYLNTIGKPTVAWGNIPFNMSLWTSLAEQFDISLFGFREEVEDKTETKVEFAQRQILTLIEQMQYMLNSDRDITPSAVSVLTKLRFLNEALNPKGQLASPSGSVIDVERMIDAADHSNRYETTSSIYNEYGRESLEEIRNDKDKLESQKSHTMKRQNVELGFTLQNRLSDLFFSEDIQADDPSLFINLDRAVSKFEDSLTKVILNKFRRWYRALKGVLGVANPTSLTFKLIENMIDRVVFERELAVEIEEILRETFSKGFSLNNAFNSYGEWDGVDFTLVDNQVSDWIQINSFGSAKEISETLKKKLRTTLRDGYSKGENINKLRQRILKEIGVGNRTIGKTKNYAQMVAKTEVARVINHGKMQQLKSSGAQKWKFVARLDDRNKNERPNKQGYTCRNLHMKEFSLTQTDAMPPLHPNCRCAIVGISAKNMEQGYAKAIDTTEAVSLIPTEISTNVEAAKPHPSEKDYAKCIKSKISILMNEHPDWNRDKAIAVAYHMCMGYKTEKSLEVTGNIIVDEIFDHMILGITKKGMIPKWLLEKPIGTAISMAESEREKRKTDAGKRKWDIIVAQLKGKQRAEARKKPTQPKKPKKTKEQIKTDLNTRLGRDAIKDRLMRDDSDGASDNPSERTKLRRFLNQRYEGGSKIPSKFSSPTARTAMEKWDAQVDQFLKTRDYYEKVVDRFFKSDKHSANILMQEFDQSFAPKFQRRMSFRKVYKQDVSNWGKEGSTKRNELVKLRANIRELERQARNSRNKTERGKYRTQKRKLAKQFFRKMLTEKVKKSLETDEIITKGMQIIVTILNEDEYQRVEDNIDQNRDCVEFHVERLKEKNPDWTRDRLVAHALNLCHVKETEQDAVEMVQNEKAIDRDRSKPKEEEDEDEEEMTDDPSEEEIEEEADIKDKSVKMWIAKNPTAEQREAYFKALKNPKNSKFFKYRELGL